MVSPCTVDPRGWTVTGGTTVDSRGSTVDPCGEPTVDLASKERLIDLLADPLPTTEPYLSARPGTVKPLL